jgi:molybdate/tungstate transport system ATP-binding protein
MISLRRLNAKWRAFALRDVNLEVQSGEYMALVGPTGAGKTLLLETIAGLHEIESGEIRLDGRDVSGWEPDRREVAMVYQDYALFPHLSVEENIAFGLRRRHDPRAEIAKRIREVTDLVGVGHLLTRRPGKLSGGEKQRVALARALAVRPRLLLLDEPLSALDPETKEGLVDELKRVQKTWNITTIHVTHDLNEALVLAARIGVMGEGRIRQVGSADDVLHKPQSEFVARFTMTRNIFAAKFLRKDGQLTVYAASGIEVASSVLNAAAANVSVRTEDVVVTLDETTASSNCFSGIISKIEDRGTSLEVTVDVPPQFHCAMGRRECRQMGLKVGTRAIIHLEPEAVHAF